MKAARQHPILSCALVVGNVFLFSVATNAQSPASGRSVSSERSSVESNGDRPSAVKGLPAPVTGQNFSAIREQSPFLRTLNLSKSLILTGVARIEDETVATMVDLETRQTYTLSQQEPNLQGWQLVEIAGDPSDVETLTARVKLAGSEVVSIRYGKSPPSITVAGGGKVTVSNRIGNGTPGGGTGPHGGPDPRVLTPDQLADARNGARNIQGGFQADGYADNQTIPPQVVNKLSQLSIQQRESVNVKMFEYRNRGLGMQERQQIYNRLLDRELKSR